MMIAAFGRRALLGVSLVAFATLPALPANADQITFVSQGGAYQKAQTIAILDPSAKKLGITINQDSIPDAWPAIKSQVASGKPTWDVVDVPTGYCLRGGEQGLIEKLDFSKIPNAAAMPEIFWTGRVTAMLAARTAVSTLSAASTALSVIRSSFSICALTWSTVLP